MFHKQKAFYTPIYSNKIDINDDFKKQVVADIEEYAKEDCSEMHDGRQVNDGRKGYYSTEMSFDNVKIPSLNALVLALQDKIIEGVDGDLRIEEYGLNIHPTGTYQTLINNSNVEFNGVYILKCGDMHGIHNGEMRLVNPNPYTKPLYQSVLCNEGILYLWPGPVMFEVLPVKSLIDRVSVILSVNRND